MSDTDTRHMRHALGLARRGLGRVWPNPAVGCVITRDGRIVGRARTADGGRPHAETLALSQAGPAARGATAYVTLEPCAHSGQTPPCAEALIAADVARVVVATGDPDPRVAGRGVAMLRDAGTEVVTGICEAEARALQRGFLSRVTQGRPMVTLKLATTLDGRIATASGESRWITGPEARRAVHALRMNHDAVLVGAGTVRADDPDLTARDLGADSQPVRIVATRHLRLPENSRLFRTVSETPVWLAIDRDSSETDLARVWREAGARILPVRSDGGHLSVSELLQALGEAGLTRVFCEGGGMLAASLLHAGLVDDLVLFSAGKLIGAEGQPAVGPLGLSALADAPRFELAETRALGGDVMQIWCSPAA